MKRSIYTHFCLANPINKDLTVEGQIFFVSLSAFKVSISFFSASSLIKLVEICVNIYNKRLWTLV